MKILLDTHAFIWSFSNTKLLSKAAVAALSDPNNSFYISVVTVWEMQIKTALGKTDLDDSVRNIIAEQSSNGFQFLDVNLDHALNVENLPPHHKDPFDRLIISQAMIENMTIITTDEHFPEYNVNLLW